MDVIFFRNTLFAFQFLRYGSHSGLFLKVVPVPVPTSFCRFWFQFYKVNLAEKNLTKGWQHWNRRRRAHQQRAPPAPQPGPDGGLQQDQHCRHHEHAGTYLSSKGIRIRIGSGSNQVSESGWWSATGPTLSSSWTCRYRTWVQKAWTD